jgi:hypothetical protein
MKLLTFIIIKKILAAEKNIKARCLIWVTHDFLFTTMTDLNANV